MISFTAFEINRGLSLINSNSPAAVFKRFPPTCPHIHPWFLGTHKLVDKLNVEKVLYQKVGCDFCAESTISLPLFLPILSLPRSILGHPSWLVLAYLYPGVRRGKLWKGEVGSSPPPNPLPRKSSPLHQCREGAFQRSFWDFNNVNTLVKVSILSAAQYTSLHHPGFPILQCMKARSF